LGDARADVIVPVAIPTLAKTLTLFQWLREHPIATPTLAILPDEVEPDLLSVAAEAVDDFILSPLRPEEWRQRLSRILPPDRATGHTVQDRLVEKMGLAKLVGHDPAFLATISKVPAVAKSCTHVLIVGETGTGKELCARAIHHLSARRSFPFIPVDCATLPDHLFENEFFGHARGAFTDAHAEQKGLVAMAEGGTLFLDEVDSLSLGAQAKVLRFLQERAYKPLGADRFVKADVHILAATNQRLEPLVRGGGFRSDLYFRLNVLNLYLSPLRERRGDIALLARHFLDACCVEGGLPRKSLSIAAANKLLAYDWPGNVRELFNTIQRAVVFAEGPHILPSHVTMGPSEPPAELPLDGGFREARARAIGAFERLYVESVLRKHHGNVTHAAREARKERRAFGRLIKKHRIDRRVL
jgi:DNA-binding NtrC family response regulator